MGKSITRTNQQSESFLHCFCIPKASLTAGVHQRALGLPTFEPRIFGTTFEAEGRYQFGQGRDGGRRKCLFECLIKGAEPDPTFMCRLTSVSEAQKVIIHNLLVKYYKTLSSNLFQKRCIC